MVSSTELENAIRSKVQNVSALVVSDVSGGCGQAYDVIIVSEAFEGLPTLKRHRMVNELLKDQIAELHAFSQKTYTPKQYETMASKDSTTSTASSTTPNPPTTSTSTTTSSSEPPRFLSTLDTTSPVPSKNSNRSHHRTRSSNVSVPELTLTTDVDDEPNQTSNTPSHGRKPSGGSSAGSPSPRSVAQSLDYDAFGDGGMLPQSPSLPNISRLLHGKVTDPEFWQELHTFLTSQTSVPSGAASPTLASGSASPAPSSPSLNRRPVGASEAEKLWEDFFQSQKQYLTASEAAKIRDVTGLFGLGGQ